jgi:hypothetical protein
MGTTKSGSKVATAQNATAEWILAEDVLARGLVNGATLRIAKVAISEVGDEFATDNTLRTVVRKESDNSEDLYNQYILAVKGGSTPVIISVGAIGRQLNGKDCPNLNEVTAHLAEGRINAYAGKLLKVRKESGEFTYKDKTYRSYSLQFDIVDDSVENTEIVDESIVDDFIERIADARDYANSKK